MKKRLLVLILVFVCPLLLFANYQKYYEVSSPEWRLVSWVTKYAGVTGPSSNGPVTGYQLSDALDRAAEKLGKSNVYITKARSVIDGPDPVIGDRNSGYVFFYAGVTPEIYMQTNGIAPATFGDGNTIYDSDWFVADSQNRSPIFNIGTEFGVKDIAFATFDYNFTRSFYIPGLWEKSFLHNISTNHTENYPYRTGVSIGNENLTFIAAKAGVSMGEGYTGNTAIGDNFDYQEFIKTGFFSPNIALYLNITNFDSSHSTSIDNPYEFIYPSFSGYLQLRHAVSMDFNIFNRGLFSFSLINLLDTTSSFDLRMINPFYVLHNMFNYKEGTIFESNNMLSFSFSIPIIPKLAMHFQCTIDQSQSKMELDGAPEHIDPNAFSLLLNLSYSDATERGRYELFGEVVYNTPCMYLNQKYFREDGRITETIPSSDPDYAWSQDYLVGYFNQNDNNGDAGWSGYYYGPDSIVSAVGGTYWGERFELSGRVFYMAHGEKGRGDKAENYTFEGFNTIETVSNYSLSGVVEHSVVISVEGDYSFCDYFSMHSGFAFSNIWNYRNQKNVARNNLQLILGFKVKVGV